MIISDMEYTERGGRWFRYNDYHTIYTDGDEPTRGELLRKYGRRARGWTLTGVGDLLEVEAGDASDY